MRTLATIGVYGWTLEAFLDALREADVAFLLDPEACHRSLIAERLAGEFGLPVLHLRP